MAKRFKALVEDAKQQMQNSAQLERFGTLEDLKTMLVYHNTLFAIMLDMMQNLKRTRKGEKDGEEGSTEV
jgi:hypothetical protein